MRNLRSLGAAVLAAAAASGPGCGSIAVQQSYWREDLSLLPGGATPYIYGGSLLDLAVVGRAVSADDESSLGVLLILDLPLSLVADTLLLPLSICQQVDRAGWTEERFLARLAGGNADERVAAAGTLGVLAGTTDRTTEALATALADPEPRVRVAALTALAQRGPASAPSAPRVAQSLRDPESEVRAAAARSLAPIGAERSLIVPALLGATDDVSTHVRITAIHALGELGAGEGAESVRARLAALRSDRNAAVRNAAARALARRPRPCRRRARRSAPA